MATIGVKQLKDQLSEYLRRAARGERILITDYGEPVAMLIPAGETAEAQRGWQMVREGNASWSGGKPAGSARPPKTKGKTIASKIIEDRR